MSFSDAGGQDSPAKGRWLWAARQWVPEVSAERVSDVAAFVSSLAFITFSE